MRGEGDTRRPWQADRAGEDRQQHNAGDVRVVQLAEFWERTSAKGKRFFSGFMGDTQILLFGGGEKDHPTKPGEKVRNWRLMVQERDPTRRPRS
jgi:hypothetical protein